MDLLTENAINKLKQDIEAKNIALEADKYIFEQKLKNGLKDEIINYLNHPKKPNYWLGLKLKIKKWFLIKKENKKRKKLLNDLEK